ncbi:MAG: AIPR family protein [Polyangiaceae bacterium]
MREREVRSAVSEFFSKHAPGGRSAEDAFPAWWLHRQFDLAPTDAIAASSTGSYDHGLDGFHLERRPDREPTLHLFQAKYTTSQQYIRKGIGDFRRTLERLAAVLSGQGGEDRENTVWTRLRARIHGLDRTPLIIHCRVVHLAEAEEEGLLAQAKTERADFAEAASTFFPDNMVRLSLSGPSAIDPSSISVAPAGRQELSFDGVQVESNGARLFVGLGKLADLVRLYEKTGDALFAKNVRLFNFKTAEHGPARFQRETLSSICVRGKGGGADALRFTLFHNGVTLHATSADLKEGRLEVRNPGILNGCQTVKNAWRFRNERALRDRIDPQAWERIQVPLRVLRTMEESLIRDVTVSNNRQTAIRASGFRANDPLQLDLGERFHEQEIFYERQENAYLNLKKSAPQELEERYSHSFDAPLTMEELAQAIASVAPFAALSVAAKVSDLFETPLYERLFSERHLRSVPLLVLATNILRTVHLALKDTKEKSSRLEPMVASRFRFLATRVLVRWVVRERPEIVAKHGQHVIVRPSGSHPFRELLRKLLAAPNTRFQVLVPEVWGASGEDWPSGTDKECSERLLRAVQLHDFDAFEHFVEE